MRPRIHDPYEFLNGHRVAHSGVIGPGSWGPRQIRTYTWRQPWKEVANEARGELIELGLKQMPSRDPKLPYIVWMDNPVDGGPCGIGADASVSIEQGRSLPLAWRNDSTDNDPEWVTVSISSALEDNWVNVLRYTFFPIPER
jgi:hypothetical protein